MSLTVYLYERPGVRRRVVYDKNITHNLNEMAEAAGIYEALWRPDELFGIRREDGKAYARELIEPLRAGLTRMRLDPERFRRFEAENGWGTVEQFLPFVSEYLEACERYPDAEVRVSR